MTAHGITRYVLVLPILLTAALSVLHLRAQTQPLGTVQLSMLPTFSGLAVTSHNAASVATAVFDDVGVVR